MLMWSPFSLSKPAEIFWAYRRVLPQDILMSEEKMVCLRLLTYVTTKDLLRTAQSIISEWNALGVYLFWGDCLPLYEPIHFTLLPADFYPSGHLIPDGFG